MSKTTFKDLVLVVGPAIQKQNTNMRECISAEERIMVTLRYLANGCTFTALALYFQRGERTIGLIIEDTTKAIWNSLKGQYMMLPNEEGWKAFPFRKNIIRPYPERNINHKMRIFNCILSRGRKTIECTFGMMTQEFQIFLMPIRCRKYETITSIIECACVLHNFIRKKDGMLYTIPLAENNQRNPRNLPDLENLNVTGTPSPQILRNYLANYFLLPNVDLPWQWSYCL